MRQSTWVDLFRLVPPALQDVLTLTTSARLEIAIQEVLRLEEEYVVVRGRLGGTTDTGRLFIIPFDQINYLGLNKLVTDADLAALFGTPPAAAPKTEEPAAEPPPTAAAPPEPPPEPARPPEPPAQERPKHESKLVLLERVRARLAAAKSQTRPQ